MNDPLNQNAPAGGAEAFSDTLEGGRRPDYTPEDAQHAIEILRSILPAEISERIVRTLHNGITDRLSGNATDEDIAIESLLPPLNVIPADRILGTEYPVSFDLVESYLTSGVWFIYGKPKIGKSWLAAQLALSVSTGGKVFEKNVKRGKVLYLALEDGEKRLKKRMTLQQWPRGVAIDYMLPKDFREQIGTLNAAGGKRLMAYIEKQNYALTVIDTFSRAINLNQLKGELMTEALSPLQEFGQAKDKAIIFIDHEPKRNEENATAITGLFGGISKSGVADGLWRLYKERGKGVKIDIEGRDLEDSYSLKLRFDKGQCYWYSEGDAEKLEITERRKEVLDALGNLGRSTLSQLEDATGQAKGHLHTRLQDLVTEGIVTREKSGANVFYEVK